MFCLGVVEQTNQHGVDLNMICRGLPYFGATALRLSVVLQFASLLLKTLSKGFLGGKLRWVIGGLYFSQGRVSQNFFNRGCQSFDIHDP